jgi:hypothetical protein
LRVIDGPSRSDPRLAALGPRWVSAGEDGPEALGQAGLRAYSLARGTATTKGSSCVLNAEGSWAVCGSALAVARTLPTRSYSVAAPGLLAERSHAEAACAAAGRVISCHAVVFPGFAGVLEADAELGIGVVTVEASRAAGAAAFPVAGATARLRLLPLPQTQGSAEPSGQQQSQHTPPGRPDRQSARESIELPGVHGRLPRKARIAGGRV